jgi:succinyl-diaminopimelate desuccinylase
MDEAEALVRKVCAPADRVEIVDRAPAAPIPEGNPHLDRLKKLVSVVSAKTAWTDVARLTARGLAAVNYGPGEVALAHRADESVQVDAMEGCLVVMQEFLA